MFSWRWCTRSALLVIALVASAIQVSGAQAPDPLDNQRRAAIRARARLDTARAARERAAARRVALPVVRQFGALVMRGDTAGIPAAYLRALDSAVAAGRREAHALFGPISDSLLARVTLLIEPVRVDSAGDASRRTEPLHVAVRAYDGKSTWWLASGRSTMFETSRFLAAFGALYVDAANDRAGSLAHWARNPFVTARWPDLVRDGAYYTLATYPTYIGRACIDGSLSACRVALALVPERDTLRAWFDGEERRSRALAGALAASRTSTSMRNSLAADIAACRAPAADSACHALLVRVGVPSATSSDSRREFLRRALVAGGPETFQRLIAVDTGEFGNRIASAARVPFDSLVSGWRSAMLEGRPPAPMPTPPEFALCFVIGAVLVAAAAGRRP